MDRPKHPRSTSGFTLIELIISILIFGIIGVMLIQIFFTGAKFYESMVSGQEVNDNMFIAQRRFNIDISNLRDGQHILYAGNTRFQFVDSYLDTIQYQYSNGSLYRQVNSTAESPIAQYLTDSTSFHYYTVEEMQIDENPVIHLHTIWSIRFKLFGTKGSRNVMTQFCKCPQNLKYGLVK